MAARKRLGDLLIESGTIDELQLRSALAHQRQMGGPLGRILVESRFVTEETLVAVLAHQLGLQVVDLDQVAIHPAVLKEVSVDDAESQRVLPVRIQQAEQRGAILYLATSDPTNADVIDTIQFRTGKRVIPLLTTESGLERAIRRHYYADVNQTATIVQSDVQFAGEEFDFDDGAPTTPALDISAAAPALDLDDGIPVVTGAALVEPSPDAWMLGAGNPLHLTSGDADVGVLSLAEGQLVTGYDEPPSSLALSSADLASLGIHESTDLLDAREALFDFSNAPNRVVVEDRAPMPAVAPAPTAPIPTRAPAPSTASAPPENRPPTGAPPTLARADIAPTAPRPATAPFVSPPSTLPPLEPSAALPDATDLPRVVATAEGTPPTPSTLPDTAPTPRAIAAAAPASPPVTDGGFGPPPPDTGFGLSTSSARFQAIMEGLPDGASPRASESAGAAPPVSIAPVAPTPTMPRPTPPRGAPVVARPAAARRERVLDVHDLASLEGIEPGLVSTWAASADDVATLGSKPASPRAVAGYASVKFHLVRGIDVDVALAGALRRVVDGDLLARDPDAPRAIVPAALHPRLEPATTALDEPTGPSSWLDFAEGQIIANRLSLDDNTDTQSLRLRFMEAKSAQVASPNAPETAYIPLPATPSVDGAPPWAPFSTREVSVRAKEPAPAPAVLVDEVHVEAEPTTPGPAPNDDEQKADIRETVRAAPAPLTLELPDVLDLDVAPDAPPVTSRRSLAAPIALDLDEPAAGPVDDGAGGLAPDAVDGAGDFALEMRAPTGEVDLGAHGGVLDVSSLGLHELSLDEGSGEVPLELDVQTPRTAEEIDLGLPDADLGEPMELDLPSGGVPASMPEPTEFLRDLSDDVTLSAEIPAPSQLDAGDDELVPPPDAWGERTALDTPSLAASSPDVSPPVSGSLDVSATDAPAPEGVSLDIPTLDAPSLDSLDAPSADNVDDAAALVPPALDDEATAPIDIATMFGAVPTISSIDSNEAMPPPSSIIAPPRVTTPTPPSSLLIDERTGLAGLLDDAPASARASVALPADGVPASERSRHTEEREATPAPVTPSSILAPPAEDTTLPLPADSKRSTMTTPDPMRDERLLGLDMLLGGSEASVSPEASVASTPEGSDLRDADWRAFLDESPDITSSPVALAPPPKAAEFLPTPDTLLDGGGLSSEESTGSAPSEPPADAEGPLDAGPVPEEGPLGDSLEAPTPTMITRLNPEELRALAARLVAKGALTRDDYMRAKSVKAPPDDEDGRS